MRFLLLVLLLALLLDYAVSSHKPTSSPTPSLESEPTFEADSSEEPTHKPTPLKPSVVSNEPTYDPATVHYTSQPTPFEADSSEEPTHKPTPLKPSQEFTPTYQPSNEPTLSPDFNHIVTLQPTPDQITLQPTPTNFDPQVFTHEPTIETMSPTYAPTGTTAWAVGDSFIVFGIVILVAAALILYLYFSTPIITKMDSLSEGLEAPTRNQETTPLMNNNNNSNNNNNNNNNDP